MGSLHFASAKRLLIIASILLPVSFAFIPSSNPSLTRQHANHRLLQHKVAFAHRPRSRKSAPACSSTSLQAGVLSFPSIAFSAASSVFDTSSGTLLRYFLEALISNGVPAMFTILVIGYIALLLGGGRDREEDDDIFMEDSASPASALYNDLYGDIQQQPPNKRGGLFRRLFRNRGGAKDDMLPKNIGIPDKEYLKVTHLNRKYDSYRYSLVAATKSKAQAAADFRKISSQRAWAKALAAAIQDDSDAVNGDGQLRPHIMRQLQDAEEAFLRQGGKIVSEIQKLQTRLTEQAVDEELESMGLDSVFQLDPNPVNSNSSTKALILALAKANRTRPLTRQEKKDKADSMVNVKISKLQLELQKAEINFIRDVICAVGPQHAASVRTAILGNIAVRGLGPGGSLLSDLKDRPLTTLFSNLTDASAGGGTSSEQTAAAPILYVCRFPGDVSASQVSELREEVTAIVNNARSNHDQVLVVLESGGGTVTGYGLAAGQLMRLKQAKLKLTIAVEQVAASGGYMMCCVADHIVASPFAVLGSIGVISDIPNVYERLKREGIEFQTVTAGKFKRTLTPTKKVTKEDIEKTKQDVEDILVLFRDFVAQNRPQLGPMDQWATGETWFGTDALDRKLCDEIKTADEVISDFVANGFEVYEVDYEPPVETPFGILMPARAQMDQSLIARGVSWLVRAIAAEIRSGLEQDIAKSSKSRYMAFDDAADRMKSES